MTIPLPPISFNLASLVGREVGYTVSGDIAAEWGPASDATERRFQPIATFPQRFGELLDHVRRLGFDHVDLWLSHLNWTWATASHLAAAKEALAARAMTVASLAGDFGSTPEELGRACMLATALDCTLLAGGTTLLSSAPDALEETLAEHGVVYAYENHPDRSAADTLARLGDCDPARVGVAVDTGWYGTQGCDAAEAIAQLGDRVFYVHLKDVTAKGAHDTCRFGRGIVPLEKCLRLLQTSGYSRPLSIEQNSGGFDPSSDIHASRDLLLSWLAS